VFRFITISTFGGEGGF